MFFDEVRALHEHAGRIAAQITESPQDFLGAVLGKLVHLQSLGDRMRHLYRTELELGNLAERVELFGGQVIGCRFSEMERYEDAAGFERVIATDVKLNRPSATANGDELTVVETQFAEVGRIHGRERRRLDRVQGVTAASHAAGVPVFEDSAGIEHEGIFVVGQFGGGLPVDGDEACLARFGGVMIAEENLLAIVVFGIGTRPEFSGEAQAVVREPLIAVGERRKLVEHFGRVLIRHRISEPSADFADDPPVFASFAR